MPWRTLTSWANHKINKHPRDPQKKKCSISRHVFPYLCLQCWVGHRGGHKTRYPEWVRGTSEAKHRSWQSQLLQAKTSQRQLLTWSQSQSPSPSRLPMGTSSMETKEDQKQINTTEVGSYLWAGQALPNGTMSGPGVEPGLQANAFYLFTRIPWKQMLYVKGCTNCRVTLCSV